METTNKKQSVLDEELLAKLRQRIGEEGEEFGREFLGLTDGAQIVLLAVMGLSCILKLDTKNRLLLAMPLTLWMKKEPELTCMFLTAIIESVKDVIKTKYKNKITEFR